MMMTHWLSNVTIVHRPLWATTAAVLRYDTIRVKDKLNKRIVLLLYNTLMDETATEFPEAIEHKGKRMKIYQREHIQNIFFHELWHCVQRRRWGFWKYAWRGMGSFFKKHDSYIEQDAHDHAFDIMMVYTDGGIPAVREYLEKSISKPNTL